MPERVDARDVLDPNARTRKAFRAHIAGCFERAGPNRWDPYEFVPEPGAAVDVLPGIDVQVERSGVEFRMRSRGRVVRAAWEPTPDDLRAMGRGGPIEMRKRFLAECVESFAEARGQGEAAFIARKLRG
jgi:hypothetical protein